jgi:hypothetical protein
MISILRLGFSVNQLLQPLGLFSSLPGFDGIVLTTTQSPARSPHCDVNLRPAFAKKSVATHIKWSLQLTMNTIPVALFTSRDQAEPIKERLLRAGVAVEIHEELALQKLWFVSKQAAGVRLEVAANQFEQAQRLLAQWDGTAGALAGVIRCPECKSFRVDYPQFARNSVMTNMAAGLAAELGLVEKDYYCEQCHYTWPKQRSTLSRHRAHMAPYYFIEGLETAAPPPKSQPYP